MTSTKGARSPKTANAAIATEKIRMKVRRTRLENSEETRKALFDSAFRVVAEDGYADASIDKIATGAGVAKGTFYNYFETRQDLFDQLLPHLGGKLLDYIRMSMNENLTGIAREKRRIEAYFEYCRKTPGFLRILNEAEVFAPKAYHQHFKLFYQGYLRSLERSVARKEITAFGQDELGVVVFMLLGMRTYLDMMFQYGYVDRSKQQIAKVLETYAKFVDRALFR